MSSAFMRQTTLATRGARPMQLRQRRLAPLAFPPYFATALGLDNWVEVVLATVLALDVDLGSMFAFADIGAVDDQALLSALHLQDELADRSIGRRLEGVADTAVDGVDPADEIDVDFLRAKSRYQVRLVRMWPCSRKAEWGRVTCARPMLESPSRAVRTAFRRGVSVPSVPPRSFSESFGLKPRSAQSAAWQGTL